MKGCVFVLGGGGGGGGGFSQAFLYITQEAEMALHGLFKNYGSAWAL